MRVMRDFRGDIVWSPELIEHVLDRIKSGVSATKVALEIGATKNAVLGKTRRLSDRGVWERPKLKSMDWSPAKRLEVKTLYHEGKTSPEIAARFGVRSRTLDTLIRRMRRDGEDLPLRDPEWYRQIKKAKTPRKQASIPNPAKVLNRPPSPADRIAARIAAQPQEPVAEIVRLSWTTPTPIRICQWIEGDPRTCPPCGKAATYRSWCHEHSLVCYPARREIIGGISHAAD